MPSVVDICNLGIEDVGGVPITSLDDGTKEANFCKRHYETLRDAVLEEKDWSFATKRAQLTPNATPPSWGFEQAFTLPPDHIRVIQARDDPNWESYNGLQWVVEDGCILADTELLYVQYVYRNVNPNSYTPNFVTALAARIATEAAFPLGRDMKLQGQKEGLFQDRLQRSGSTDGRQGRTRQTRATRLTRVR